MGEFQRNTASRRGTPSRLGTGMIAGTWIILLGLLTLWFSGVLSHRWNPNDRVQGQTLADGVRQVVLAQNAEGHYVASGRINGHRVTFLVDTGATTVSVPAGLAHELGLRAGSASLAQTANGTVTTYDTRLARVELGNIRLENVRANINPGMRGGDVLLGMSFLRRLELIQRGASLTLRQYPSPS